MAGLSAEQIAEYENALGTKSKFPHDFKAFLQAMNGTDLPTLNVYGYCGELPRNSVGVYSYPRDVEVWAVPFNGRRPSHEPENVEKAL
jgi:hypothetical protein